jgi:hypothetical protein
LERGCSQPLVPTVNAARDDDFEAATRSGHGIGTRRGAD